MEHVYCFETIRNNTALKQKGLIMFEFDGFETIRNNTALKHQLCKKTALLCFETIRNNTALKLSFVIGAIRPVLKPFETTQL